MIIEKDITKDAITHKEDFDMKNVQFSQRRNIFGGCNVRIKTSFSRDGLIYYCSNNNILISDDVEVKDKDVIYLDNFLNFVKASDSLLISGDISGTLYIIKGASIERHFFKEALQDACLITDEVVLCVFLKTVLLYDTTNKNIIKKVEFNSLISTSAYSSYIFLGTADGDIQIYDKDLNKINTTRAHEDRVQDINLQEINLQNINLQEINIQDINIQDSKKQYINLLASSSKDGSIKIWEIRDKSLIHRQTLVGHNDWVNQINWGMDNTLISASSDKSIMVWKMTDSLTLECEDIFGGSKPFINGFFLRGCVIGQSHSGSFYKYKRKENKVSKLSDMSNLEISHDSEEGISDFISGHIGEVTSLDWKGEYLLSTSLDKTARIFCNNREIGRPITHGYEISAGKFLNDSSLSVILGSYETIIRVLEPTYLFYLSCEWINEKDKLNTSNRFYDLFDDIDTMKIAAVPAELSLTNDVIEDYDFVNVNEYLLSTTTFVETRKMYGHYFEISDIFVSPNYIISCNRSLTKKFSGIFLWNKKYEIIDYLEVHSYGIIKLRISPDEKYICAVSKDKSSSLYEIKTCSKVEDDKINSHLSLKYRNYDHKRVVWDCAFSFDSKYYATCSRDRKICIYNLEDNTLISHLEFTEEVTALDFSPKEYLLVCGTEKGEIYQIRLIDGEYKIISKMKGHSQRVNVVKFNNEGDLLSTGGKDGLINTYF